MLSAYAIALATDRDDVIATPLENPRQTSAFEYARSYSPQSPKFSRAMALSHGHDMTIFISGTASITNSESRHPAMRVAQAHESLDNIEALISEQSLARHGLAGFGSSLQGLAQTRVYVKHIEDYPQVMAACDRSAGPGAHALYSRRCVSPGIAGRDRRHCVFPETNAPRQRRSPRPPLPRKHAQAKSGRTSRLIAPEFESQLEIVQIGLAGDATASMARVLEHPLQSLHVSGPFINGL